MYIVRESDTKRERERERSARSAQGGRAVMAHPRELGEISQAWPRPLIMIIIMIIVVMVLIIILLLSLLIPL